MTADERKSKRQDGAGQDGRSRGSRADCKIEEHAKGAEHEQAATLETKRQPEAGAEHAEAALPAASSRRHQDGARMKVRTIQVDEAQLLRYVRDEALALPDLGIVISGMSGRFPKCDSINEFEENLREGRDMINDNDNSRFTCGLWNLPPRAGRLKDLTRFDHDFFGFAFEHANYIDFQLRILYEVVYEAILDAGLNPANLRGSNTGVFFGLHCNEFENAMADDPAFKTSGYYAQFAIKVAQYFDFRGLALTFDAACASGFVALHNGTEALRDGIVDQAIVCSSNIPIHPTGSFIFYQMQMLSPTGYSRFLDSRADGYVKSEACVAMVLQRKHLAKRNWASLMATMTSVDGYKPEGITFPSDRSQETLIRETKQAAGVSVNHIEYLEAHGTGTPAGDPQEARAISNVYYPKMKKRHTKKKKQQTSDDALGEREEDDDDGDDGDEGAEDEADETEERRIGPLLVGSVKTSMGHSEAASGLCALAKVALMFEHELIYKNLHFEQPNTNIEALMDGRLKFVDQTQRLRSKIVPLSCYGFGGSNVHAIVRANERHTIAQDDPNPCRLTTGGSPRLVLMFGRGEQQLNEFFDQLVRGDTHNTRYCATDDFLSILDSISSQKIDRLMNHRGFLLLDCNDSRHELARSIKRCELRPLESRQQAAERARADLGRPGHFQEHAERPVQLLFPGLGCQWPGMARGLSEFEPFWSTIERLDAILSREQEQQQEQQPAGFSLVGMLQSDSEPGADSLERAFVAIVGFQVALTNLVKQHLRVNNLGSIVGHSLGEISCAYAAGLLSERDTILIAQQLGKTLDRNKLQLAGKMVALVGLAHEQLELLVGEYQELHRDTLVAVSCLNGPDSTTISGRAAQVDDFLGWLTRERGQCANQLMVHEVSNQVALHNERLMDGAGIRPQLRAALAQVLKSDRSSQANHDRRARTSWISSFCANNEHLPPSNWPNGDYFVEMLCRRIDFGRALDQLPDDSIVYELAPSNPCESQIVQMRASTGSGESRFRHVRTMLRSTPAGEQLRRLLSSFGELYQAGATFDLGHFYERASHTKRQFPVRRQTPSLSSITRWNHASSLFVPRYPLQFSKSSAKCEVPIDLVEERDKFLAGHCVEGRILQPATGYLFLIWRIFSFTKRKIYDACFQDVENELVPIEFRNVRLLRAVILSQRRVQMYIHYEEATGRFEVKEGGSVVCEGYAFTPDERPLGLLYDSVRAQLERDPSVELTMKRDDVYKQFRVSGYDYGDTFQCIQEASSDGRLCRVKFNGHFIALTDSILQSIFLAIAQYAPPGSLFLPTRFEYVRFQPAIILAKLHEAKMAFDQSDGSLNTKAKREMMSKIMERDSHAHAHAHKPTPDSEAAAAATATSSSETDSALGGSDAANEHGHNQAEAEAEADSSREPQKECIFDTYCDPQLGIIITDGIEMRGIKASPAPRRVDNSEVLLESYQFVPDHETPVRDERLTRLHELTSAYLKACNSLSLEVLTSLCADSHLASFAQQQLEAGHQGAFMSQSELDTYLEQHLDCRYQQMEATNVAVAVEEPANNKGEQEETAHVYDIKKNGPRTLMSVLEQLRSLGRARPLTAAHVRQRLQENRLHLMRDLLQQSYLSERFVRPLVETAIENVCQKKTKLRMLEINTDDGILRPSLQPLVHQIEPSLQLDYALAHPDPNRLHGSLAACSSGPNSQANKTHTLKSVEALNQDSQLKSLDLVVYKDASCYTLLQCDTRAHRETADEHELLNTLKALNQSVRAGGYFMLLMREKLTLAERVLMALSELPDEANISSATQARRLFETLERADEQLSARCATLLAKARHEMGAELYLAARKSDEHGCLMLLFRRLEQATNEGGEQQQQQQQQQEASANMSAPIERLVLRVRHDDLGWLEMLRSNFRQADDTASSSASATSAANTSSSSSSELSSSRSELDDSKWNLSEISSSAGSSSAPLKPREPRQVWLCAVLTRQSQVNGLIGMMQALRKELGSQHLRCFYDAHTFRHQDEPVSTRQIVDSARFQEALRRDQLWNCVDELTGQFGSFRHFTINEQLSYENCLCAKQKEPPRDAHQLRDRHAPASAGAAAYVNTMTRGDLSSLSWFEAPFAHLKELDQQQQQQQRDHGELVRVAYSALNFRDIMLATGRLPLDALPMRLAMNECLLGLEFSGHDSAGRRVMGMVSSRGIATHVLCPRRAALKLAVPAHMSLAEAATIPIVYATAIMALVSRGQMRAGESVLVHAGSGGVGQAAIRLALHFGLQVFATVGSEEKRQFLLDEFGGQLRREHIFSSRSCQFEQQLMWATRGRGVDLVLNSLAEDKLQASLNCLADGGRFLEIGKYDLTLDTPMELLKLHHNKTFHGILLDKLFDQEDASDAFMGQLNSVLALLERGLREGFVKPIKYRLFKHTQMEQAFRFMATGKHIGKVLIEIEPEGGGPASAQRPPLLRPVCVPRFQMSPRKSYIVTGALGGFGLELCKWLVAHGARHLVLTSRSGPRTGYQRAVLARLESQQQARLLVVTESQADATTYDGALALCRMARALSPARQLGGIFHLAMVLKDALLDNMSAADFRLVCRPKVEACVALDQASRLIEEEQQQQQQQQQLQLAHESDGSLDLFVAFSSVTSGKGNAGQANYAYANSCLERVCESRRAQSKHGLAIQWGAIGDVGVAFENLGGNEVVIGGTIPQRMPSCLATLGKLLCSPYAVCLSLLPVNRNQEGLSERGDLVGAIMHVLGIKDASKVSEEATLGELGLDSLMAVEIRQYIEREYDKTLNIQEIRALTIGKIREIGESGKPSSGHTQKANNEQASSLAQATDRKQTAKKAAHGSTRREVASYGQKQTTAANEARVSLDPPASSKTRSSRENGSSGRVAAHELELELEPEQEANLAEEPAVGAAKTRRARAHSGSRRSQKALLDKRLVSSFVPALQLAKSRCCLLNEPHFRSGPRRPIFFLAPIHGQFDQLKTVCAHIRRPCVGLNWTSELNRAQSVEEAARAYLGLLQSLNWDEFTLSEDERIKNKYRAQKVPTETQKVVDIVGYSFGATIGFELMRALSCAAGGHDSRLLRNQLTAGRLVLLDGSPKQIELGSRYLAGLARGKSAVRLSETIDELLMLYVVANTRPLVAPVEQLAVRRQLASLDEPLDKLALASSKLVEMLRQQVSEAETEIEAARKLRHNRAQAASTSASANANDHDERQAALKRAKSFLASNRTRARQVAAVRQAMEAYLRRYELIRGYQVGQARLAATCVTLVRAEQVYLKRASNGRRQRQRQQQQQAKLEPSHAGSNGSNGNEKAPASADYETDLGLTSLVEGRVELHVLPGDHESFLLNNCARIAELIMRALEAGEPDARQAHCNSLASANTTITPASPTGSGPNSPDSLLASSQAELGA